VKTPDDGQRNCPKCVEFDSKNKIEKLVHLVGFIIRNVGVLTIYKMLLIYMCVVHLLVWIIKCYIGVLEKFI
jgi:hypothetical protein